MDATAYHLQARAPFHFGLRGVGLEATTAYGPSDTLFAALCHVLRQQCGLATLEAFLAGYQEEEPPMLLSSAFPYVPARREGEGDEWQPPDPFDPAQVLRFFPRPLEPPPGLPDEPGERKRMKQITWLSEGIFRAWVSGEDLGPHYENDNLIQGNRLWLTGDERERVSGWRDPDTDNPSLWAVGDVPRVTVDRLTSASIVYQAGRVWFPPGGGLWLLMHWRADWQERGELAWQVLGDAGLGGERSAGHGLFHLHGPHPLADLPDLEPGGRFVSLSLYYPTETEMSAVLQGEGIGYRWQMRRGWMASPDASYDEQGSAYQGRALRRKAVRMFDQGSILRWPQGGTVRGQLADVTPDVFKAHKVWRYGLIYAVGYRGVGGGT